VTVTVLGTHKVKAFTGAAAHSRHDVQWQYPIATGSPTTRISTAPQKHRPCVSRCFDMMSLVLRKRGKEEARVPLCEAG